MLRIATATDSVSSVFHSSEDIVHRLRGQQLTLPYIINNGFNKPILVEDKNGLDLIVPHDSFNVLDVENYVGKSSLNVNFVYNVIFSIL